MYNNYTIIEEKELKDINSKGVLLKHNKTNAKVLLIMNDDENKTFGVGFRTPPHDATGVPHIIEHSVLCGSRKYPVKEPFVELMKGSLNTFLNAMTFDDKTVYPVSSCNDKDFQNLVDVYLDAVFYPNILENEKIFKQEGWHFEYDKEKDELTYNGVVYNEMKGVFSSPDSILSRQSSRLLFPDTSYGEESGGDPDDIPNLTYENFIGFYKKYYHPSNSYIFIYGNCDMEEKLEYIDKEYLSAFDAIDPDSEIGEQPSFEKRAEAEFEYPISAEQSPEKKTLMSYSIAMPAGLSAVEYGAMDVITSALFNSNGAPLQKALLDAKIGESVEAEFIREIKQPCLYIAIKNGEAENKDKLVEIIEEGFKKYIEEGINKKTLQGLINISEFKAREADFGGLSKGLIFGLTAFQTWLYDENDAFSSFEFGETYEKLREELDTDFYEKILEKYFLNNPNKAVVIVKPSKTIQDEKDNALKARLQAIKEGMTAEELEEVIKDTAALKEYQETPDTEENLSTLPHLQKEDLTEETIKLSNIEKCVNGIRLVNHDYNTNKIAYLELLFDISKFSASDVQYIALLSQLLSKVDTASFGFEELDQEININTGGIRTELRKAITDDGFYSYLVLKLDTLYPDSQKAFSLLKEIILSSNFDNKAKVFEILSMSMQKQMQYMMGAGHALAVTRANSYRNKVAYLSDLTGGIDYYNFLNDILANFEAKYPELISKLFELSKEIFVKEGMIASVTCDQEGFSYTDKLISDLSEALSEKNGLEDMFEFEPKILNEAFKAPMNVNFDCQVGDMKAEGYEYGGSLEVLTNILNTNYFWNKVRVLGGAYGCFCSFDRYVGFLVTSYRDPNVKQTFDVYKEVVKYLEEFNPSEEEMLKYIIGAVGSYDSPKSPKAKGITSLACLLNGKTTLDLVKFKKQIIDTTIDDIKKLIEPLKYALSQNIICTVGNDKAIDNDAALFGETKNLFK